MKEAFICEGARSPIGRFGGALSSVRPDNLLADIIRSVMDKIPDLDPSAIDDAIFGCANQAGEDNRNVARMAVLLAGLPISVPASTVNRLCGSGLDAVGTAARAIASGEAEVILAGGVESMSRAPFVMPKADAAFSRRAEIYDTTLGWRFVNKALKAKYGIDSMPETAENVAVDFNISRQDQDSFALRSQQRAATAIESGRLAKEITPVFIPQRKGDSVEFSVDEHPRATTLEKLASLSAPFKAGGCITAGNASGVNDGAAALIIASEFAVKKYNLTPKARFTGMATAGVEPRIMGIGPAPACKKLLSRLKLSITDIDVIELNEAFAAQVLCTLAAWESEEYCRDRLGRNEPMGSIDRNKMNVVGSSLAVGHPFAATGARIVATLGKLIDQNSGGKGVISVCTAGGMGVTAILER